MSCWHCWQTWALNNRQFWLPLPASTRAPRGQQIEGSQKAWPFPVAFQVCRSAGPLSNISAAAGESAAAAQQQKPEQKPWRVPGAVCVCQDVILASQSIVLTSPYDSLSPLIATFDFPVFLSISTDLSLCPASYLGGFAECSMQPCYAPSVLP